MNEVTKIDDAFHKGRLQARLFLISDIQKKLKEMAKASDYKDNLTILADVGYNKALSDISKYLDLLK